ncbi:hypothetical protein C7S18_23970 (plasmid) [Ahniella affigens]|uniref:Uncharacterized protein n=1 Tax=Ahniella affigens TaxID=2021234 RepID=A0A2P1PZT3_9GAMM|nr:hypothetical protein C7S18_23970 [Ahniella affigens]
MSLAIDQQPLYLNDINRVLAQIGLSQLTADQCRLAGSRYKHDDIKAALKEAPTNASWRTWLRELVEFVRSSSAPTSQPQMPPPSRREAKLQPALAAAQTPAVPVPSNCQAKESRLAEINRVLVSIGCRPLTTIQAQTLATKVSTEHLKRAIAAAQSSAKAAEWLRNAVTKVSPQEPAQPANRQHDPTNRTTSRTAQQRDQPALPRRAAPAPVDSQNQSDRRQVIAYGAKAAIAFTETDLQPHQQERTGYLRSILIKAAQAKDGQDCKKGVAWNTAVVVNLGPHEVQLIAAVLLNRIPSARFAGHGHTNEKWFEFSQISDQKFKGSHMATFCEGRGSPKINVRITHNDVGRILSMFLRVCCHQLGLESQAALVLPTIHAVAAQYGEAMNRTRNAN